MRVIFEDREIYVISKPAGLKAHGGEDQDSVESRASQQAGQRLILLHRLDRGTTGLVLLAKTRAAAAKLSQDFEAKRIRKAYIALVRGSWRPEWNRLENVIEAGDENRMRTRPVESAGEGGRRALTTFRRLFSRASVSLVEAIPKTGRKHQIRLHCADFGCPVIGDPLYGPALPTPARLPDERLMRPTTGLALHAYRVDFRHPRTGEKLRIFDPPPANWPDFLAEFETAGAPLATSLNQACARLFPANSDLASVKS